jgi:DNA-binding transcriptional LysR family regulator
LPLLLSFLLEFVSPPDSSLIARPLRNLNRIVRASPTYLARHGTPQKPDEPVNHNCLAFHHVQPERDWLFQGAHAQSVRVVGQLTINNGPALFRAALANIGIAMLPDCLVAEDLAAGRLVRLFPEFYFERAPLPLVYLPDRHITPSQPPNLR